ncbi:MAG: hypothetical protein VB017_05450 [Endomicrobiaceae bacterium]|nr:hypothetical protein [Endomicrobiaceae bacterium]
MAGLQELYNIARANADYKRQNNPVTSAILAAMGGIQKGMQDQKEKQLLDRQYATADINNLAKLIEMKKLTNEQNYQNALMQQAQQQTGFPVDTGNSFLVDLAKNSNNDMISKYLTQINGNNNRNIFDTNRQEKVNKLADVAASASNLLPSEISMSMTGPTIKYGDRTSAADIALKQAEAKLKNSQANYYDTYKSQAAEDKKQAAADKAEEKRKGEENKQKFRTLLMQQQNLQKTINNVNGNASVADIEIAKKQLDELQQGLSDYRAGLRTLDEIVVPQYKHVFIDKIGPYNIDFTMDNDKDIKAWNWAEKNPTTEQAKIIKKNLITKYQQ